MNELNILQYAAAQASIDLIQGIKAINNDRAMIERIKRISEDLNYAINEYEEIKHKK